MTVGLARSLSERVGRVAGGAGVYLAAGALCRLRQGGRGSGGLPARYIFGCGSLFVLYLLSFYLAIGLSADRAEVLGVGLANYLWPSLTILFSLALLGKTAGPLIIPGSLLALGGVLLAMSDGAGVSISEMLAGAARRPGVHLLAAFGAVLWALYSNLTARWMGGRSESAVGSFMMTTGAALLGLAVLGLGPGGGGSFFGSWTPAAAGEALALGLATAAGYECWEASMRKGDVALVAAASYFTPLLSTIFSCLYLGVRPGTGLWAGCGLVVAGSLLSWRAVSDGRS